METDSSIRGWGACLDAIHVIGSRFHNDHKGFTINTKELLAIYFAISTFAQQLRNTKFLIKCDNKTAIACIKKMGSFTSELRDTITLEIFELLQTLNCQIEITYIASKANIRADFASRHFENQLTEWTLDSELYAAIKSHKPDITCDLFASHLNAKEKIFCTWSQCPGSFHVDAFTFDWNSQVCFAFPPFSLLGRCMQEIKKQNVQKIYFLIPWWPTAVWFPQMVELLADVMIVFPKSTGRRIRLPWSTSVNHPLAMHLR